MKPLKVLALLILSALVFTACGEDENDYYIDRSTTPGTPTSPPASPTYDAFSNQNDASQNAALARLEFPHVKGGNSIVVVHECKLNDKTGETGVNYCVEWDTDIHAQRWSCYQMYASLLQANTSRYQGNGGYALTPDALYPNDSDLPSQYQFTVDPFKGSGYDHGHICPSNDRLASYDSNYQTFFMTNMMPQVNAFNSGIWARMELKVHSWTNKFDMLYVCKGGTIDKSENIIRYLGSGQNKIPVPKYFYMALLGLDKEGYHAMGFWIEHSGSISKDDNLSKYMCNIRQLEELTGIDFFCNLPGDVENTVETLSVDIIKAQWQ